ncbi:hypothetical protein TDB9533_00191 [Thalassocella blandensis]|nr:hypothetical protein TDB9533_00191 [Thalassocella blandensis]
MKKLIVLTASVLLSLSSICFAENITNVESSPKANDWLCPWPWPACKDEV